MAELYDTGIIGARHTKLFLFFDGSPHLANQGSLTTSVKPGTYRFSSKKL